MHNDVREEDGCGSLRTIPARAVQRLPSQCLAGVHVGPVLHQHQGSICGVVLSRVVERCEPGFIPTSHVRPVFEQHLTVKATEHDG
jgi:hypothetical protein